MIHVRTADCMFQSTTNKKKLCTHTLLLLCCRAKHPRIMIVSVATRQNNSLSNCFLPQCKHGEVGQSINATGRALHHHFACLDFRHRDIYSPTPAQHRIMENRIAMCSRGADKHIKQAVMRQRSEDQLLFPPSYIYLRISSEDRIHT